MWGELNPKDKEIFPMDFLIIDEVEYMKHCILGARQFCMKEDLSTLPKARRHQRMYVYRQKLCASVRKFNLLSPMYLFSYSQNVRRSLNHCLFILLRCAVFNLQEFRDGEMLPGLRYRSHEISAGFGRSYPKDPPVRKRVKVFRYQLCLSALTSLRKRRETELRKQVKEIRLTMF